MTSKLFEPIDLRGVRLANRIMVSPMCQYSADYGSATDWHMIHLGHLALGGAGLLMIEATGVEPVGRITPGCLGLWSDENEAALERVIRAIRQVSDIKIGIQLAHAGRKASTAEPWNGGGFLPPEGRGWIRVAPSAISFNESEPPPHTLTRDELPRVCDSFVQSARRADRLGLDAIELHGAHGYLLQTFVSALSNRRTDDYGGSLENRLRFPLEVFLAVRAVWPAEKPLGMRVSASEWIPGGWSIEDTIRYARELKAAGCDWVDCSGGGNSPAQQIPLAPGYQAQFAEAVRREVGIPTIAVGLITDPRHAEELVAAGKADMVALARGMLYDPRWAWHAAAELGVQVRPPKQYGRAAPRSHPKLFG